LYKDTKRVLSFEKVEAIVNAELDPRIKAAREMSDRLRLHIDGTGLQDYLERINNYENELQFEARKTHAISNKFLTEELLRPVDNAFHARGGSKTYKFTSKGKEDDLVNKLVDVKSNASLSEYVEQEWFHRFVTDPNGLIFMEIKEPKENQESEDDDDDNRTLEPTYKSIHSIRAYEQNGVFIDWVIFEPHETIVDTKEPEDEEKQRKRFWAVDESFYYLYEKGHDGVKLIEEIENSFERVPAILCSNIVDNVTGWKKSPIDSQIELLDKYLVDNSVKTIVDFFHSYPQQWTYVDECNTCHGSGMVYNKGGDEKCSSCDGTGKSLKKDVTDILTLKIPDADGVKIDPPSGYIFLPTDGVQVLKDTINNGWNTIHFSHWGTNVSKDTKNETATGRFIDVQPVNNRLNKYSKSIEQTHTALANFIGEFYFPETFERAIIQYGRRYLIETPDQIWEKYIKSKKDNAPTSTLDLLLSQFLESEFRENEQLFFYEMKKVKLEPFVHWDILTVQNLNVNQIDYFKKLYFSDWIQTKEVKEIIETKIDVLDKDLTTFAEGKIPESEPIKIEDEKV
jgi:hypothetical protein